MNNGVEALESRRLMDAGDVDVSFGDNGAVELKLAAGQAVVLSDIDTTASGQGLLTVGGAPVDGPPAGLPSAPAGWTSTVIQQRGGRSGFVVQIPEGSPPAVEGLLVPASWAAAAVVAAAAAEPRQLDFDALTRREAAGTVMI